MSIAGNLTLIKSGLPDCVTLVAVSKTMPAERIIEAYDAGQRIFGENRVQELLAKQPVLPSDIEWDFIGHLQTNKVKYVVPVVSLIHSADSSKLVRVISDEAVKAGKDINVLLQVRIALEETKFGMSAEEAQVIARDCIDGKFGNVIIRGLMGMATLTGDEEEIRKEFSFLSTLYREMKQDFFSLDQRFNTLSMGMSDDFRIAIEEGSTMIRIGSYIFGHRGNN